MGRRASAAALLGAVFAGVLAACGGGGSAAVPASAPSFGGLEHFAAADVVFGQPIFAFNEPNRGEARPGPQTLACPGMPSAAPLFLPDVDNHRVLGFLQPPIISNLAAHFVLGQPGFDFASPGTGATALRAPCAAEVVGGRLVVADTGNHRVLVWRTLPVRSGAAADLALGQPDLVTGLPASGAAGLERPAGLAAGGGRLLVADRGNHRVLIWSAFPEESGAPADLVLGQADFDATSRNRGRAASATSLADPWSVWTDGTRVVVADTGNHRVLVWTTFPTHSGQPADLVLGQPDFGTVFPGVGPEGLYLPSDIHADGVHLAVADAGNHRVLLWYRFPDALGTPADTVLGQAGFDQRAPNDDDQDGGEDAAPSARTLKSKDGLLTVRFAGSTLYVGDTGNHRLLVFRSR